MIGLLLLPDMKVKLHKRYTKVVHTNCLEDTSQPLTELMLMS